MSNPLPTLSEDPMRQPVVRTSGRLLRADLEALVNGEIIALRVPDYCSKDRREQVVERILLSGAIERYKRATGVARIGKALVETKASAEESEAYFGSAIDRIRELRTICAPELTPFDRFRLELDEEWQGGAHVAPFARGKAFTGLFRLFEEGGFAHPHQDTLERDAPLEPLAAEIAEQIAMNIYLQTAADGGELEIWNVRPSVADYVALRNSSSHGIDREKLPASAALIKPEDGDLILFRSTNLHAVRKVEGQRRITWATFIGYRGVDKPLILWS